MNNKIAKKKNQEKNKRMTFSFGNKEKPPHTFSDMKWFSTLLQYWIVSPNEATPLLVGHFRPLFCVEKGWKKNRINRKILDITGFLRLSPIILRGHTCATLLVMHGISLLSVSKWLGHSTLAITEKFYLHFDVKSQIELANKMGEILSLNISNDVKDNLSKYEEELITPI